MLLQRLKTPLLPHEMAFCLYGGQLGSKGRVQKEADSRVQMTEATARMLAWSDREATEGFLGWGSRSESMKTPDSCDTGQDSH